MVQQKENKQIVLRVVIYVPNCIWMELYLSQSVLYRGKDLVRFQIFVRSGSHGVGFVSCFVLKLIMFDTLLKYRTIDFQENPINNYSKVSIENKRKQAMLIERWCSIDDLTISMQLINFVQVHCFIGNVRIYLFYNILDIFRLVDLHIIRL